jgi:thiopurine S-methyltransferase
MEPEFWIERWRAGDIGFHELRVNPLLERFVAELKLAPGARVFVPLCGKSLDLVWFARAGLHVLGVELSPQAVAAFFAEHDLPAQRRAHGPFECWSSGPIEILCGDFFALAPSDLVGVAAAYDRAALIALPPALRPRYARRFAELMPTGARVLLIAYDYPPGEMDGPPFSVGAAEVEALYAPAFEWRTLASEDALARKANLRARGLSRLTEAVYLLRRRA